MESCVIDGFGPLPVTRPTSVAELGETVRSAAVQTQAIYPIGGCTALDLGNTPTKPGIAVDLRSLDQVIDFPARDMTITVQAGMTIAKLQALLAAENLRLPIDVPEAERATLGGILATNVSGPRRYGYGTLRDYVIGISAVNDEGREFKAGGRVVKNVAGYDLCKLLIGSLGTLGIITQATLKLRPLAEETALVSIPCGANELGTVLDQVHSSRTRPVAMEALNQRAAGAVFGQAKIGPLESPWIVIVGYEGNGDAVHWQVQQLVKELGPGRSLDARVGASAHGLWTALVDWRSLVHPHFVFKNGVLPSEIAQALQAANRAQHQALIQAHAGNGVYFLLVDNDPPVKESEFSGLSRRVSVVLKCPAEWKSRSGVWGNTPPPDGWLMRRVKEQFDPRHLFNPGRFVDGI